MARKPPEPKPAPPLSFAFAVRMAREYFELGVRQYNLMATPVRQDRTSKGGLTGLKIEATEQSISAAMILAFATELSLKALIAQRRFVFPQEHNIQSLFGHLPDDVKQSVALRFGALRADPPKLLKFQYGTPQKLDYHQANTDDFDSTIKSIADLFTGLRYLHEEFNEDFAVTIDFHWLILMCQALTDEIEAHRKGRSISYGSKRIFQ